MNMLTPWWYGMPLPSSGIYGKSLFDGRKVIPKFFVEVRAFIHPQGDCLNSWRAAEEWFRDQGWIWVENEEWYLYSHRVEKDGGMFFKK